MAVLFFLMCRIHSTDVLDMPSYSKKLESDHRRKMRRWEEVQCSRRHQQHATWHNRHQLTHAFVMALADGEKEEIDDLRHFRSWYLASHITPSVESIAPSIKLTLLLVKKCLCHLSPSTGRNHPPRQQGSILQRRPRRHLDLHGAIPRHRQRLPTGLTARLDANLGHRLSSTGTTDEEISQQHLRKENEKLGPLEPLDCWRLLILKSEEEGRCWCCSRRRRRASKEIL